uniref:FBD domain-containing protein n=1 Tax=Panagrolaimus davidi TaxID=227884 RepID=A0A914PHR7_9BILA
MNNLQDALPSTSKSTSQIYTFKRPYPQRFSLPFDVIKYMIKNCKSAKVWKKLITSCKFFYPKYPILPVKRLDVYSKMKCFADGEIFNASKSFPKLWVYDVLVAGFVTNISVVILNVFKFDLRALNMPAQSLTFDEYKHLTSSGSIKEIYLESCAIKNADGTIVTADKLVENLKLLERFEMCRFNPLIFQSGTMKKMVQHLNECRKFWLFRFLEIQETFDFASLVDFLLKNKTVTVILAYRGPISDAYKENVANVLKEIKKDSSLKYPCIKFDA